MEALITCLKIINISELEDSNKTILNQITTEECKIINAACKLANELLISEDGHNKWNEHDILSKAGFRVFSGETDGFGWITGCIQTKKGLILYG